jgi:hypothetical protein
MRLRSARVLLFVLPAIVAPFLSSTAGAQSRTIDEGTFIVTIDGKQAAIENFKITRVDSELITGAGQVTEGAQRITSSLTTDAAGTPIRYEVAVRTNGVQSLKVAVNAVGGRLTATSSNQRGDESMRDYRLAPGRSVILEDGIIHQLYFLALGKRTGAVVAIAPRDARSGRLSLSSQGLEPTQIAGRTVTANHYVLGDGVARRDFWVDASGKLLRMEFPSRHLIAVREEPPK